MNGGPEWLEPNPNDAAPQAAPVSRIQRITYSPDYKTYTSSIELMCRGTAICSNIVDTRFTYSPKSLPQYSVLLFRPLTQGLCCSLNLSLA